ncbi:hypothetical protein BN2537_15215 [Streptomyces venezuelae]|nr:hypothetical protein BN2537_15215 [Streptomyces venezuelae]
MAPLWRHCKSLWRHMVSLCARWRHAAPRVCRVVRHTGSASAVERPLRAGDRQWNQKFTQTVREESLTTQNMAARVCGP